MSSKMSQESGLRYGLEERSQAGSLCPDDEDIQAFLKTLDALPHPPSLAAQAAQSSRSHLPSTSSSLSAPSVPPSPPPLQGSDYSPGGLITRLPMTRAQVDDTLKRMAGSFNLKPGKSGESDLRSPGSTQGPTPSGHSTAVHSSVGLLTASRPGSAVRRVSGTDTDPSVRPGGSRRQTSDGSLVAVRPESVKTPSQLAVSPLRPPVPTGVVKPPAARSLPGNPGPLVEDNIVPLRPAGLTALSPQTTGGTSTATNESSSNRASRRGPVLLRGGFGEQRPSSSPSHSPIRHRALSERQPEDDTGAWHRLGPMRGVKTSAPVSVGAAMGYGVGKRTAGQRTAPSSLGGEGDIVPDPSVEEGSRERGRGRGGRVVSDGGRDPEIPRGGLLGVDW